MALKYGELSLSYDTTADVMYVSIGEPRVAVTVEDRDGVLVRKDPKSGKPIAVTIVDYDAHFRKLRDISWLAERELPQPLVEFLKYRPSPSSIFNP